MSEQYLQKNRECLDKTNTTGLSSQEYPLKKLSFYHIINRLRELFATFPDCRTGLNISKRIDDAAMCTFAMFFTQSPSFLAHQQIMCKSEEGKNNAQSLFGIEDILSDNHIRNLMDQVWPSLLYPVFKEIFDALIRLDYISSFRSYKNNLLLGLDGTQFFSSPKICCDSCCKRTHVSAKSQKITYSYHHSIVMAAIVHPQKRQVISLQPEFITPQDGNEKQDCEINASIRWLSKYGHQYISQGERFTILGDDLYSHQPFCLEILEKGFDFILTCKPSSHKTLYEYVELEGEDINSTQERYWSGKRWLVNQYRFVNDVPLRDGKDALNVNWFELTTIVEKTGEVLFHNSWVSNFKVTQQNVAQLVNDGRARWKIENENNNVLKTKGYHLEHNFGHGKKYLSQVFLTFNILAFLVHTVLELVDDNYLRIRSTIKNRQTLFNDIRTINKYLYFANWNQMLFYMMKSLGLKKHDTS